MMNKNLLRNKAEVYLIDDIISGAQNLENKYKYVNIDYPRESLRFYMPGLITYENINYLVGGQYEFNWKKDRYDIVSNNCHKIYGIHVKFW